MKRVLTGVKPTGYAHIGNYFGAIKPAIDLANQADVEGFIFVADYHALTTLKTKEELKEYTYEIACTYLACGLDVEKAVFYKQSAISEVFELNWILANVTPKGLLNRAHAYKACVDKNEAEAQDRDAGVNMGLYNYPVLMSADILLFDADYVPVGLDQQQHIEIARDIAKYFNNKYGKVLTEPKELIQKDVCTLVGLDGRKMSKSYNNTIKLFGTEKELQKTINRIVTDSTLPGEPKPLDCTINTLYKLVANKEEQAMFEKALQNGLSWGEAKKQLFEKMNEFLSPMREKFNYYMQNKELVDSILQKGAHRAKALATAKLKQIRTAIGAE